MSLIVREMRDADVDALFDIRARTRDNPMSRDALAKLGITPDSTAAGLRSARNKGWVCCDGSEVIGFCIANSANGAVLVLAVPPSYEGRGVGKRLLGYAVEWLRSRGFRRLWLATSADAGVRARGFYRAQGWRPTGELDADGDEVLVFDTEEGVA